MKKFMSLFFNRKNGDAAAQPKKKGKMMGLVAMAIAAVAALPTAAGAAPIDFTGQTVGVTVGDAVGTGFNFAKIFDEWTLLAAGLILAPIVIGMLIWLAKKGRGAVKS